MQLAPLSFGFALALIALVLVIVFMVLAKVSLIVGGLILLVALSRLC